MISSMEQNIRRYESVNGSNGRLLILFGSVTGNAESVARRAAEEARRTGFTVRVRNMAHCQANILTRERCVLIVTSTFGDGQPPDDAALFWEAVVRGNSMNLRGLMFSVLALGDSTYDHFCRCGRELDAALERLGATRFFPRVDCDTDFDEPASFWIEGVLATLQEQEGFASVAG